MIHTPSQLETVVIEPPTTATHSIIWMHGLGADGHDFVDIVPMLNLPQNLKIRFIFPHAPVRPIAINMNMQMRGWFDVYSLSKFDREDLEGIYHSQSLIEELIAQEINKGISSKNIILAGFSQGGAMALFTGLCCSKKIAGILALSCFLPGREVFEQKVNSINKDTPILLTHGTQDNIIPMQLGLLTRDYLIQSGHAVEWKSYPMGHEVCGKEIADIGEWIGRII